MGANKTASNMRQLKRQMLKRMKQGESIELMLAPYHRDVQVQIATYIKRKLDG